MVRHTPADFIMWPFSYRSFVPAVMIATMRENLAEQSAPIAKNRFSTVSVPPFS